MLRSNSLSDLLVMALMMMLMMMVMLRLLAHRPWQATVVLALRMLMVPPRLTCRVLTYGESAALLTWC